MTPKSEVQSLDGIISVLQTISYIFHFLPLFMRNRVSRCHEVDKPRANQGFWRDTLAEMMVSQGVTLEVCVAGAGWWTGSKPRVDRCRLFGGSER